MTVMTRWSPVGELAGLEIDRLNRMFDAAFAGEPLAQAGWMPAVDIHETAQKDVVVTVDLPGMKREDIKVTFENNVLSIEGDRQMPGDVPVDSLHRAERGHGAFRRNVALPPTADGSRIEAGYVDGVLTVKIPRREESKPRQIPVNG